MSIPRPLLVGVPVVVFLAVLGVSLAMKSEDGRASAKVEPTLSLNVRVEASAVSGPAPSATAVATPAASATPVNRSSCTGIRGTPYQSEEERAWFLEYCPAPTPVPVTVQRQTVSAPSVSSPASSNVYGTSDRLVISRLRVNAPVNVSVVGPDGAMGNPLGSSDVVLYDFAAIPGLGGYPPQGGNTVIAGHVDYICCPAVFYQLRNIEEGDVIDYYTADGGHYQYVVQWFGDYAADTNWASIVSGGPNIMTLITCNGTFDSSAREYSHRRVVRAVLVQPGA